MIYDVKARQALSEFVKSLEAVNRAQSISKKKEQHQEFERLTQDALKLLNAYQDSPESSAQARFEYLDQLLQPLRVYKTSYMWEKKWWQKILNFFGFMITPEERGAQDAFNQIEKAQAAALTNYNNIHYPNWLFRVARFFGFHSMKQLFAEKYALYAPETKLTYLSHHLMGTTNLIHHEVLQGKNSYGAYHDFVNDIDEFIELKTRNFDQHTRNLLVSIKNKMNQCSDLAAEMDKASIISSLKLAAPKIVNKLVLDLAYQVHKSMMNLEPGSSLIIPSGFKSPRGGHATVVECIRGHDGFIFKVINTGAGEDSTESYKTLFISLLRGDKTRPIKVTSELSFEEVASRKLIEKIIKPTIVSSEDAENEMNNEFVALYDANKLHDDPKHLTLQTNGTCSHSSLLEWFKTQVSKSIFSLFQHTTIEKAHHRLKEFKPADLKQDVRGALSDLNQAAEATAKSAKVELTAVDKQLKKENAELRQELDTLLKLKGKDVGKIEDFTAYSEKKCRGTKLSEEQQRKVAIANSLDPLASGMKKTFFSKRPNAMEARMRKAIIAKQIAGHEALIPVVESSLTYNTMH